MIDFLFFEFLIPSCFSWSGHPHLMIAEIAKTSMTKQQIEWINKLLGLWKYETQDFTDVSNWQDTLRSDVGDIFLYWHFVNKPIIEEGFELTNPVSKFNITVAIQDELDCINNPNTTSLWTIQFAIRSLIHFIGDIHCPVHNVDYFGKNYTRGDAGGNKRKLINNYGYYGENLHKLWDSAVLQYYISKAYAMKSPDFAKNLSSVMERYPKNKFNNVDTINPQLMADEAYSVAVSCSYGKLVNESYLAPDYFEVCRPEAQKLIAAAGYRLAAVLNTFFDKRGMIDLPEVEIHTHSNTVAIVGFVLDGILALIIIGELIFWIYKLKYEAKRAKFQNLTERSLSEVSQPLI